PKAGSSPSGPNALELFVDGNSATVGPNGLDLSGGGRLTKTTVPGGLEFDFPDGSVLFTTPTWWDGQNIWYFNISLTRPPAIDGTDANSFRIGGIAGPIESGDWLPRLPNGSSMGPRPGGLDKRYVDLYQKFADAWRVKQESSLFTYPKDTSTDNFTLRSWPPPLDSTCTIPQGQILSVPHGKPVKLIKPQLASKACLGITDKHARQNCIFDVQVTGSLGFAKTYRLSERVVTKSTRTTVSEDKVRVGIKELAVFTATVAQARADGRAIPTGSVQFMVDGRKVGKPIPLDKYGQARWKTSDLQVGKHQVTSSYIPDRKKGFSPSLGTLVWHIASRD
ncbi:MAG: Ig-like domain repeat protein, partial [Nitrospira sp.]|nr:Ig-like domain repeat protein [Nitrospira sp.]